jgi:hypothetical protein
VKVIVFWSGVPPTSALIQMRSCSFSIHALASWIATSPVLKPVSFAAASAGFYLFF